MSLVLRAEALRETPGPGDDRLTPQEYALRHHLPLELVVDPAQIARLDRVEDYPAPHGWPSERARAVLRGLALAGLVQDEGDFVLIPGEVRRLDLLFWVLGALRDCGFRFRQEYRYAGAAHRLVALNRLKVPAANLRPLAVPRLVPIPPPDLLQSLAVCLAHVGECHGGYVFLDLPDAAEGRWLAVELLSQGIEVRELDAPGRPEGILLRTRALDDSARLLDLLGEHLAEMPGALERFAPTTPEMTVCKEVVFDSAHFLTDHPARCSNLHGGRYSLRVKVAGRIDPVTGCVLDYGYLKRVTTRQVVERFDHHTLNYAASELAWRSSTEMLCVFIWEQLIDYLPGLVGLELYETPQSWCSYRGPSLEEFQRRGPDPLLGWLKHPIERAPWRALIEPWQTLRETGP